VRAKGQSEFASWSKTEFLANMSHEIRTRLNSLLGYSQLLAERASQDTVPDYVHECLGHINLNAHSLLEMINNILELSNLEVGKVTTSLEVLDLSLLIQQVHSLSLFHTTEKGIDFHCHYDPGLPRVIRTDRAKLTQILNNLISNAIKFTPPGKAITLDATRVGDRVRLSVTDEGIGIAKSEQAALFEGFEQTDGSNTHIHGGTGLGLPICRHLSLLLGGNIEVESTLGEGSTFVVEIPLDDCTGEVGHVETVEPGTRFAPDSKILVVEDNPMNQAVIRALFKEIELDITLAEDGLVGVQKAMEMQPECIFMDLHMPHLDGLEATRQLRELPQFADVPIIALSADACSEQEKVALEVGMTEYLTKPIILERLVSTLMKYLRPSNHTGPRLRYIIDHEGLEEYSPRLFEQLRDMFVQMVPVELAEFERCVTQREYELAIEQSHNLKNYGVGVFAKRFTDVAGELETEARRRNWVRVTDLVETLRCAYADTVHALEEWGQR
jgi:CheY-like chemotaxis protein